VVRQAVATFAAARAGVEAQLPKQFEAARAHLLPRVRDLASEPIAALGAQVRGVQPTTPIQRPLGEHLRVVVVYDAPSFVADVPESYLATWGQSRDAVIEVAIDNLAGRPAPFRFGDAGVYVADGRDQFDAARLLLEPALAQLEVKGRLVAFPLSRDLLAITGERDEAGLAQALRLAASPQGSAPISVVPLLHDGTGWVTWHPDPKSKVAKTLQRLMVQERAAIFEEQRALLDQLGERRGDDAFVAALTVLPDGTTLCTWGEGTPTLLPEADRVALAAQLPDGGTATSTVTWAEVQRVMGPALAPVEGLSPPRYRVTNFPSAAERVAMHATMAPGAQP
jgi:hypothetical protein